MSQGRTFRQFLAKIRKPNGDYLLPATKNTYERIITESLPMLQRATNQEDLVNTCNFLIHQKGDNSTRSAFVAYLRYLGYGKELTHQLVKPQTQRSAFASKKFLQSKVLQRWELAKLIDEVQDDMLRFAIALTYDTACRRSEVMGITVKDLERPSHEDLMAGIKARIQVTGKGAKAREVYMRKTSYEWLVKLYYTRNYTKESPLIQFTLENGRMYKSQTQAFYDRLTTESRRILGREVHPHMLRHTQATHMAEMECDTRYIAAYLGHEEISVTQIYIEISNAMGRRAASKYTRDIKEG